MFHMTTVEMYLAKQDRIILEDKQKTLIALGLTRKEYSPNNIKTWEYDKYDYQDGEKHYYKEVAIEVSDEEYTQILEKTAQVEAIRAREAQERNRKNTYKVTKQWTPIFKKPIDEHALSDEKDKVETGKSKAAKSIRIMKWIIAAVAIVYAIILSVDAESFMPIFVAAFSVALEMALLEGFASILDYQAEQLAILRSGYKYSETAT